MTFRVQHVDGEYRVVLSAEAMEALHLTDGAQVDIKLVKTAATVSAPVFQYLTNDEALQIFRDTEEQHREAYQELAK
ncbi:hypothetical protein SAMN05421770_101501 [Granulicella rosea]|uniref:Uncharacterized protein n=1 Tax=Granulicella rosea TaxID=474952 RepID=A0A239DL80_9BACT|nr:hypothetical protein [Granulicella rosea]SNS32443.1 hypothetical protein SAMN05421770_101501 [Granulicella rosea]